ncbi:hypothetical protein [Microbacterium sp. 18062]|uniref:hypothetical protein n=1 Tax=Microbacterium sp. 18062 TaxID=2681410 RepID=UPI001359A6E5|nr:hypothetical protein [Microbacterium sp. 18062]
MNDTTVELDRIAGTAHHLVAFAARVRVPDTAALATLVADLAERRSAARAAA